MDLVRPGRVASRSLPPALPILFAIVAFTGGSSEGSAADAPLTASPAFQVRAKAPEITEKTLAHVERLGAAKTHKVWVYFSDKDVLDETIARARLTEAQAALTPHAAKRRAKNMDGAWLVDFHDLPVAEGYVAGIAATGAEIVHRSRWLNAVSVRADLATLRTLAALPYVQKLQPVARARIDLPEPEPSPPGAAQARAAGDPYDYGASRAQLDEIGVIPAHALGHSGAGVVVAMLDTGYDDIHPAFSDAVLNGRILDEWDFVSNDGETRNEIGDHPNQHDHGTYTWSALGGFSSGNVVGPAFGASFLIYKTEDLPTETTAEEDNWCAAAERADLNGADVISSSVGYIDWYDFEDLDGFTPPITRCADLAVSRGIFVAQAAGNSRAAKWGHIITPADGFGVCSVGAVDSNNNIAGFSSPGPTADGRIKPEVTARGVATRCATPNAGYGSLSGTSLSAPLVGGAAALVMEAQPTWSVAEVRQALMETATNAATPDNDHGWGRIHVISAIGATVATPGTAPVATPRLAVAPNPFAAATVFELSLAGSAGRAVLEIFDANGRLVRTFDVGSERGAVSWDGTDALGRAVAPGVYLARLTAGDWRASAKLVRTR